LFFGGFALVEVIVVVAAVTDEFALANFDDAADELVEELAVVRDNENRAGIGLEIFLEPKEGFEVEVVGWFVEQEEIGLLRQQASEMGAHDPAAAHFAGGTVEVLFAEAEAGEDLFGFGFETVAAEFVEAIVDVVVDFFGMKGFDGMIGFPGFEDAAKFDEIGSDGGGEFNDGFIADGRVFLREIADADAAFARDFAFIGGFVAEDDGKERGFAGAVGTNEPDAVLAVDLNGSVGEQDAFAVSFGDAGQG